MMPCYVINMEKDVKRKENITNQLDRLGISHTLFRAVNGNALSAEEMARHYDKKNAKEKFRELVPGEIGCALSHLGIYRDIVEKDLPAAFVLEDDANLIPEKSKNIPLLSKVLTELGKRFHRDDCKVVLLSYVKRYQKRSCIPLVDNLQLADVFGETFLAHAYFITNSAARSLLENTYPVCLPCDHWHTLQEMEYIEVKAVVPYCVGLSEYSTESNLEQERVAVAQEQQKKEGFFHFYLYRKFIFQFFVKHLLALRTQKKTW